MKHPAPDLAPPRMIHGICSSEQVVDHAAGGDGSHNCVMLARGFPLVVPVPLLLDHQGKPIGKVIHFRRLGTQIYCRAVISNNAVWRQIEAVQLRGLSCSFASCGRHEIKLRDDVGIVKYFSEYALKEVSIVDSPANGDCYFRSFSGGHEMEVAGQPSLSEYRRLVARARATVARLNKQYR